VAPTGNEIHANNINLSLNFHDRVDGLSFRFDHGGGNVNLKVNGEFINIEQAMTEVDGANIGGTDLSVSMMDSSTFPQVGQADAFLTRRGSRWLRILSEATR